MTKAPSSPAGRMLAAGGVALEDAADAARCYPHLWSTAEASRKAFQRARRVPGTTLECPAPLRAARYQRAGVGTRPTALVFDPVAVPPDDLQAWLRARLGPVARFDLAPQRQRPDPTPEAARAPPGPPEPVPASPAAPVGWDGLQAVQLLQQRLRLAALVQRLWDVRPKREHGVRQLDWAEWEAAGRDAAELPSAAWSAWRAALSRARETRW